MRRPKILAAYDDPGGGLAVSAVLRKIIDKELAQTAVYSGSHSIEMMKNAAATVKPLKSGLSFSEAVDILQKEAPGILLTATGGGMGEQQLRNAARKSGIKSYVILDFWKHYARRWLYADHNISEINDIVLVPDDGVRKEMISEGFPEKNIIATGQPYIDLIFNHRVPEHQHSPQNDSFLFLSQPSETIGLNSKPHPLENLIQVMSLVSKHKSEKPELYVKLHPLEELSSELRSIVEGCEGKSISIILAERECDLNSLMNKCPTVIGFNTIALFEARALGRRVISLDAVPMSSSLRAAMHGAGIIFSQCDEISLAKVLGSAPSVSPPENFHSGAIDNCINTIFRGHLYESNQRHCE